MKFGRSVIVFPQWCYHFGGCFGSENHSVLKEKPLALKNCWWRSSEIMLWSLIVVALCFFLSSSVSSLLLLLHMLLFRGGSFLTFILKPFPCNAHFVFNTKNFYNKLKTIIKGDNVLFERLITHRPYIFCTVLIK